MKFESLEKEILKVKITDRDRYYSLLNTICESDLDNMDMCKKVISKSFSKKLTQNDEVKLRNKIQQIFGRKTANLDGDESLICWLDYIDVDFRLDNNKIILGGF